MQTKLRHHSRSDPRDCPGPLPQMPDAGLLVFTPLDRFLGPRLRRVLVPVRGRQVGADALISAGRHDSSRIAGTLGQTTSNGISPRRRLLKQLLRRQPRSAPLWSCPARPPPRRRLPSRRQLPRPTRWIPASARSISRTVHQARRPWTRPLYLRQQDLLRNCAVALGPIGSRGWAPQ